MCEKHSFRPIESLPRPIEELYDKSPMNPKNKKKKEGDAKDDSGI